MPKRPLTKKVGNVSLVFNSDPGEIKYTDGAESELLNIFKSTDPDLIIEKVMSNSPSWPMIYHLSRKRSSLLNWYSFAPGSSVLEVGAGCGAITEALVKNNIELTALEIDPARAQVNAERNKKTSRLKVIVENLKDFNPKQRFDYIVCVGVLEYSGKYIPGEDPYGAFLGYLRKLLKSEGTLLLAIENKLGLKYFAGAPEDHTGIIFDSLNNYPDSIGVKTFSKNELSQLLRSNGFENSYYYYPHPDYKLPHCVFSDDLYPGNGIEFPLGLLPTPTPEERLHIFSEQALAQTIEQESIYPYFANSFLVEASSSKTERSSQKLTYFGQVDRKDEMAINTSFTKKADSIVVSKQAASPAANEHLSRMVESQKKLQKVKSNKFSVHPIAIKKDVPAAELEYPFVKGKTLERHLLEKLQENNLEQSAGIIRTVVSIIDSFEKKKADQAERKKYVEVFGEYYGEKNLSIQPGIIDLNLDNFIMSDSGLLLIDYEWVFDFPVTRDYVVGRMLITFFRNRYADLIHRNMKALDLVEPIEGMFIPSVIYNMPTIKNIDLESCYKTDLKFQAYVRRFKQDDSKKITRYSPAKKADPFVLFTDHLASREAKIDYFEKLSVKQERELVGLTQELKNQYENNQDKAIRIYKKIKSRIKK